MLGDAFSPFKSLDGGAHLLNYPLPRFRFDNSLLQNIINYDKAKLDLNPDVYPVILNHMVLVDAFLC
jgi:hypothetical protein